ncbi:MAG: AAA family ATPase [Desulfobacterales bacterium]|nr:AAA family ATPase [Desulfobacterales bacterium]
MYNNFFGFKERPFRLVPDPAFFFLSKSHEEAMAHLTYAISQGDGFVEIIGEVGTGKTTLCRALLEKIEEEIEVAYIFNPKLDALQLLKAINDEFGIDSGAGSIKGLIDTLNSFLIERKAQRKKAILLIDEAQNLTKDVLEQIRLLSNLETSKDKLLQIILVGQPELAEMLDSHELRQLGQRITLSSFLKPLTYNETRGYIQHRIDLASQKGGVKFSRAAMRAIYRYSSGIPRLVNIASDRTLLVAFSLDSRAIKARMARSAIRELTGRGYDRRYGGRQENAPLLTLSLLAAALAVFIVYQFGLLDLTVLSKEFDIKETRVAARMPAKMPGTVPAPEPRKGAVAVETAPEQRQPVSTPEAAKSAAGSRSFAGLEEFLQHIDARSSREAALRTILKLWGNEAVIQSHFENMEKDRDFFRLAAKQNGFSSHTIPNDLELVKKLNLPLIIECYTSNILTPKYVSLRTLSDGKITLTGGAAEDSVEVQINELMNFWTGAGHIFWKNYFDLVDAAPGVMSKDSAITLKMLLRDIGFKGIHVSPGYDGPAREAVMEIQEKHGIVPDGIVGSRTKIVLYNEIKSFKIPYITQRAADH